MSQPTLTTSARAVVIDTNILVASCQKLDILCVGAILTEVLFILCRKLQTGETDATKHKKAVEDFNDYMSAITPSPQGDIRFILRNEEIHSGYSCLHSPDAF